MWFKRIAALGAVLAVAVAVVVLTRHSDATEPQAVATATPIATPKKASKPKQPKPVAEISGAAARRKAIPILMYHVINRAPAGVPNAELWVDKDVFADEMRALRKAGYTAVTLAQAWSGWKQGGPLPKKPIILSFDDGYLSHYTNAKPALRKLGWPGVLYLEIKSIGPGGLTEHQIRSLINAGWEIDSHTLTHPDLTTLDDASLRRELVDSRKEIRTRFGVKADFFAYPAGRYDDRVEAATKAAGYKAAVTTDEGVARGKDDPFALKRVRVNASDTAATLLAKLRG
ncbi:polysaccharide deacetylase family protein [Solirubrobacter soli]|uniref:polysaccharide deacetylase family protein n=1 Tax=Solirubrobacter soli TaxID=363832 RepID=UPI000413A932|nr:polysaccharide deacetylase family protein [Solirubrobacter soli]